MACVRLHLSSTSLPLAHDRISCPKSAKFDQIPSWFSLKTSHPPVKLSQISEGRVENLHLISLCNQGKLGEAREFLKQMNDAGVPVAPHSWKCLFETCAESRSLSLGKLIHDQLRYTVKDPSGPIKNYALQMYCNCGSLTDARKLFDEMLDRNLMSWSLIISAYADNGFLGEAFALLLRMLELQIKPNSSIYITLLKSLAGPTLIDIGKELHSLAVRTGLITDSSVATAVSNMYMKCGCLEACELAFRKMDDKKAAAWTGLMVGYNQAGKQRDALELFIKMLNEGVELDQFVFSILFKACVGLEMFDLGRQIHSHVAKLGLEADVSVGTPLVDFYVKSMDLKSACQAFENIREPNDVSWSAILNGYCQSGMFEKSLKAFKSLRSQNKALNPFIYTSMFMACSALADFSRGTQIHGDSIKRGLRGFLHGESALITMYSKCGRLDYACRAFESISQPDNVAWTAIICGNAYHGKASEALGLFQRMVDSGVRPNAVTIVGILTACSHSGLVTEAKHYLESMLSEYGVAPTIDHYNCMIDIYARAGLLNEAFEFMNDMPFSPDAMSWKCLLSGCWSHRNLELGKIAANKLRRVDPDDTASYILLFNLYASTGKWEEAAYERRIMAERNLKKELSCSWITVKGKVHRFIVGDKHHPRTEEIYSKLKEFDFPEQHREASLLNEDDLSGSLPERKEQLLDHSERLAIAYGLISAPPTSPIMIFKNLRACRDCHEFAKHVSNVTGREIVVRDSRRFHEFREGWCSCNDYW